MRFTGLYNLDACGRGYIVRNNRFLPQRRHALLARATGGLFEGNEVVGIGGEAVYLGNETGSFYEGPFPANTIIRNNSIRDTGRNAIRVIAKGRNAWARNITIEDNTFHGWSGSAMYLSRIQNGIIRGNRIEAGDNGTEGPVPVIVKQSEQVWLENNLIDDKRPGLQATFDLSSDVDASLLVMRDNPTALAADFPRLMKTVPPLAIQLRGEQARPLRTEDDTGAFLRVGARKPGDSGSGPVWTLHPPWKNGLRGSLLFELTGELSGAGGIRFDTRSATGQGDGVQLTVEWKSANASNSEYRTCYEGTIRGREWATVQVPIEAPTAQVMLRFRFDCGPADNAGYDTAQIANIGVLRGDSR